MTSFDRKMVSVALVLAVFVRAAAAAESPSDYAAALPLTTQGGEALYRVELPVSVYAGVQHADLRDVRVFNAANELVPYALVNEAPPPPAPAETFRPNVFPLWTVPGKPIDQLEVQIEQRADGSVVSITTKGKVPKKLEASRNVINYVVDASAIELPLTAIVPQWTQVPENYIGTARVEASDDLKSWRTVIAGATLVYLVQGQTRLQQDRISFPPTKAKYFRMTLGTSAPLLSGLTMEAPALRSEPRRQSAKVAGRAGAKPNEIEFDVGVRAPVDRVRIVVNQTNALAPVKLESRSDPKTDWRPVVSTIAYRIVRDGKEIASPEVPVALNPSPAWRIVVDPASGGLGTPPPELEASWTARNLVFLARGQGPYTLAFGKKDATAAAMPLTALFPGYRDQGELTLPAAAVGELRAAPPPAPSILPSFVAEQDPKRLGLWAALIAGVLLLAAMAWRLSRQMQRGAAAATSAPVSGAAPDRQERTDSSSER
jgi:hypothetical protein